MAIPPDLDINIAMQRINSLSATVASGLVRLDQLEHRVRTMEAVHRADGYIVGGASDDVRDGMAGDIASGGE
jgi:hypothetical protein